MKNIPSETFFRRDPKGAMLMFSCMVILSLLFVVLSKDNTSASVYKQQAEIMYGLYMQEKRRCDSITSIKDNQIEQSLHLFDSTLKAKTEVPVRKILKSKL